jgi:ABC-type multidrug transport system permease subunit
VTAGLKIVRGLVRRAFNEILRVPGAAIPGVLAPTIFFLGLTSVFSSAAQLRGYEGVAFKSFIIGVGLLQGASFTGAATGVNLARDIEAGWFDRLLLAPVPRPAILGGLLASAALRSLLPVSFLLCVGLVVGVDWPGLGAIVIIAILTMGYAAVVACYASIIALRFRTQQAAPLMQIGGFIATLFTTAYAPFVLLQPWLETIARLNPVTRILQGVRQGFIGGVTWADTWPAFVALGGLSVVFVALALRALRRTAA